MKMSAPGDRRNRVGLRLCAAINVSLLYVTVMSRSVGSIGFESHVTFAESVSV